MTALFSITSTKWGTLRVAIGLVEFLRIREFTSNLNIGNVIVQTFSTAELDQEI